MTGINSKFNIGDIVYRYNRNSFEIDVEKYVISSIVISKVDGKEVVGYQLLDYGDSPSTCCFTNILESNLVTEEEIADLFVSFLKGEDYETSKK